MPPSPSSTDLAKAQRHAAGAVRNLDFARSLRTGQATDPTTVGWAITALFYAAVHAVRAHLVHRHGEVVTSHEDLRHLKDKYTELNRTLSKYSYLKQQSESARYYLNDSFTWADFDKIDPQAVLVLKTWLPGIPHPTGGSWVP